VPIKTSTTPLPAPALPSLVVFKTI
jgi:hypothetical protein